MTGPANKQLKKATIEKILTLFEYRRLTDLLKISGLDKDKSFVEKIIQVQFSIYMLDAYLESQWDLDQKEIDRLWDCIYSSLKSLDLKKKEIHKLVEEIEDYETIERACRKDQWPTKVSMKKFYITKSCDVRLIRHLIYRKHPDLNKLWKESAWKHFDIITEINDDVADVEEDIHTFNINRFLISTLRKGSEHTYKKYSEYLSGITQDAAQYFKDRMEKGNNKQLASWTAGRSKETAKLLDELIKGQWQEKLSSSYLLSHMK